MTKIVDIKEGNIQAEPSIKKMKVRALLVNSSNEILIANYGGVYLLPGGTIEEGEDPNSAIIREIREETGIDKKIEDLKPFLKMRYYQMGFPGRNGKKSDRLLIAYYYLGNVESLSMENNHLSEKEKRDGFELKFYSLDEIERLIKTNASNNPRKAYFDKELITVLEEYKERNSTMKFYYNKLVRDKVIENIKRKGHICKYRELSDEEYKKELDKKLLEEANEVIEAHSAEELGDLMEVIEAIMKEYNISFEELKQVMQKKREEKGAFNDKLFLISVDEKDKEKE